MSIKEDILVNLQMALESILTDNGYSTSVRRVTRDAVAMADLTDDKLPMLQIADTDNELQERPISTNQRVTLTPSINGFLKASANLSTLSTNFQADLKKCLHAADLGASVMYVALKELGSLIGDDIIFFSQKIEILYYYPEANP
jgi:hypothetical protein